MVLKICSLKYFEQCSYLQILSSVLMFMCLSLQKNQMVHLHRYTAI